ncbi:hypothetical protein G9A89_005058 [Geosiphon pyriformis]|nr:hypothetical protein G9A89_005058 [Geosiphon pyriformis]
MFEVYTNGSLKNAGSAGIVSDAATYFLMLDLCISIGVYGLAFSILAELQTVALSLECVLSSCFLVLHLNSQAAIDVCVLKVALAVPDFHNQCWIKRRHIVNLIRDKNLMVSWIKIKSYSGVYNNDKTDAAASVTAGSPFFLPVDVYEHFLVAKNTTISDNVCYFVRNIFRSVCHAW